MKSQLYRDVIDELVRACNQGQGQIGAIRAQKGAWNAHAEVDILPEQFEMNALLSRLDADARTVLARMLTEAFASGVFESLKVMEKYQVEPFRDGYEASPFNDFIGRLHDWKWPD